MGGRIRPETAQTLLALALRADRLAAAGLIGKDDRVHEPLEEVAVGGLGGTPGRFERLMGLEIRATT
jgi:hypothetical protein